MDNPQHYQPLSHALHPPLANPQPQSGYSVFSSKPSRAAATTKHRQEEEEEEEEDDDGDVGIVEDQLNEPDANPGSNHSSPEAQPTGMADSNVHANSAEATITQTPLTILQESEQQTDPSQRRRRPGRPRGSKNRKLHPSGAEVSPKQQSQAGFYSYAPAQSQLPPVGSGSAPPQHPDVNAQNQQYYEFQWRVLNLCAEFYGAAEELVKATPSLVIAQCYHMGPNSKVDPLTMLGEAKKICDTLLANPVQLIANPPPPLYPKIPNFLPQSAPAQNTDPTPPSSNGSAAVSTRKSNSTPSAVITNPQSFIVSLGSQPPVPTPYSHSQYPAMYVPPPTQYPTAPYYQYSGYVPPGTAYYPPPPPPPHVQQHQTPSQAGTSTLATPVVAAAAGLNQGAWSDEETERLKKLAEQSKNVGTSGDMEWDWVVHQWGNGRTRHQILIKATSLGLKESSSRGLKRRRETEASPDEPRSPAPDPSTAATNPTPTSSTDAPAESASPQALSTSAPSPAVQPRPPPSKGQSQPTTPAPAAHLPWPMPTVAVNAPSPVITAAVSGQPEPQRTSYYRPRAGQGGTSSKGSPVTPTTHQFMYQPNGSRLSKENGK